jgi:hypothetical protein
MANAGMERSRLMEATRHASAAVEFARAVHHRWILDAATRPAAAELKLAVIQLKRALEILRDPDGMQWDAAIPLQRAAGQLNVIAHSETAEALQHANLAWGEIAESRPTSGGTSSQ